MVFRYDRRLEHHKPNLLLANSVGLTKYRGILVLRLGDNLALLTRGMSH